MFTAPGVDDPDPSAIPELCLPAFRLDPLDLALVRRQRRPANQLALALQIGCVRCKGTLAGDLAAIPSALADAVREQLGLPGDTVIRGDYRASAVAARHRAVVRTHLGYREPSDPAVALATGRWLLSRVWHKDERPELLYELLVARLRGEAVLIPAARSLERLISRARSQMERRQHRLLSQVPTRDELVRLEALLAEDPGTATIRYQSLRRGPRRISGPGLAEALDRLATVRSFGGPWDLGRIPALRLARLAAELDVTSARDLRRMPGARRQALLVACVHRLRRSAQDDALAIFDHHLRMLMSSLVRKEREARLGSLRSLDRAARDLALACGPLLDPELADDAVRAASFRQVPAARLEAARRTVAETVGDGGEGLARLAERRIELRRILPRLLGQLELEANPSGQELLKAWHYLATLEGRRKPDLGMAPTDWLRGSWRALVWKPDGTLDRTLYSWAVLDQLRDALRRRDVYAPESLDHRDPRRQLLEGPQWSAVRPNLLRALGLPEIGAKAVEHLTADLARAYRRAEAALDQPGGTRLVSRPGRARLSIPAFEGLGTSPSVVALERRVAAALPQVDLSELLLEVDAWTGFTDTMVEARRGQPRGAELGRSLCAALLAQACNLGLRAVSSPHDPALRLDWLEWVRAHYLAGEAILAANARLVDAQSALPMAAIWSNGQVASADGMRFVVPVHGPHAMPNPRYFGRRRGITYYNFVSDQYSGFHAIVLPGTLRDSLFVLDGLLEQRSRLDPRELMTDTAGYSDLVFALFWLLGFQFSPRLRDLDALSFWRIGPQAELGRFGAMAPRRIQPERIAAHWEDLLRIAGSLQHGSVRASDFMRSLQAGGRVSRLRQALVELGRVVRTVYLLGYLSDADERRRVQVQLNRGESRHALARAVFFGRRGEIRQAYKPGQEDQLGALGMVVNAIALWNTLYLGEVVAALQRAAQPVDPGDLAQVSPLLHAHILMTGRYRFELPLALVRGARRRVAPALQ